MPVASRKLSPGEIIKKERGTLFILQKNEQASYWWVEYDAYLENIIGGKQGQLWLLSEKWASIFNALEKHITP